MSRVLALAVAAAVLAGCSAGSSSTADRAESSAAETSDGTAAHTPTDLKHPCDLVDGPTASKVLGEKVTTKQVSSELAPRTLDCSYVPAAVDLDAPFLEIRSTPDPRSLDALVGLYLGVDRLQHHPVDVAGGDDAEVVLQPDDDLVTVFVKQGFVTHTVVLGTEIFGPGDLARAEPIAVRLAAMVVRGNR